MASSFQYLDLIDTISERHLQLRKMIETIWNDKSDIYLSNSEWYIIAKINQEEVPISHITKQVNITRQATRKLIKGLEAKGIVETFYVEHNKRKKFLRLTKLGKECYEKSETLKIEIEKTIAENIGNDNFINLKKTLTLDWGI